MNARRGSLTLVVLSALWLSGCIDGGEARRVPLEQRTEALSLLCLGDHQCDDDAPCTLDLCVAGICVHAATPGCCETDEQCSQELACATATCVLNECVEVPILGCDDGTDAGHAAETLCSADDVCDDENPCTDNICLLETGVCVYPENPLCCQSDADCGGVLDCLTGRCIDNRCELDRLECSPERGSDAGGAPSSDSGTPTQPTGDDTNDDSTVDDDADDDDSTGTDDDDADHGDDDASPDDDDDGSIDMGVPDNDDSSSDDDASDEDSTDTDADHSDDDSSADDSLGDHRDEGDTTLTDGGAACDPGLSPCVQQTAMSSELTGGACSLSRPNGGGPLSLWVLSILLARFARQRGRK